MDKHCFNVIIAGGKGTRFWPLSRAQRPKQLLKILSRKSLIDETAERVYSLGGRERTLVVTVAEQVGALRKELSALPKNNFIAEPLGKNTAPCIGLAALEVLRRDPKGVMVVLPADHWVADVKGFQRTLKSAVALAKKHDRLITIGIRPDYPETGYGYLQRGELVRDGVYRVARFVEKPDGPTAHRYLAGGDYLWNSGMFFFTARRLLDEARTHMPELATILAEIRASADPASTANARYPGAPKISIDYGIMEKATGIRVVPGDFGWNDVGSWSALADIREPDGAGNVALGDVVLRQVSGSVVVSEPGAPFIGVVGVDDVVVVATRDAVLVVRKDRAQEVRAVVDALGAAKRNELL